MIVSNRHKIEENRIEFRRFLILFCLLLSACSVSASAQATTTTQTQKTDEATKAHRVVEEQPALATDFTVNGLKAIVKKRAGSQTVAAGLFIPVGVRNIPAPI